MNLTGSQLIGFSVSSETTPSFYGINPLDGSELAPAYAEASSKEVHRAVDLAHAAFQVYRKVSPEQKATFLEAIADEILALGEELIHRASAETGLPNGRFVGERGRTMNQLKMFANWVREGSWVGARIDTADPERKPFPKPDVRQMQIPLGPVGIFGASNFPLAFSVAGGDTASALAAGCPVVVKGHPAHPGTSELVGQAIIAAAKKTNMPEGVFSLVHGPSVEVGMAIVTHPLIKAVGFTGSLRGGKALFDAAARRPEPIPVYAEMGSSNPVFILPGAMQQKGPSIAKGLAKSVTLGVGQFCTNPGLVIGIEGDATTNFAAETGKHLADIDAGPMLTKGIQQAFYAGVDTLKQKVEEVAAGTAGNSNTASRTHLLRTNAQTLLANPELAEEVFGPSSMIVSAKGKEEMLEIARNLEGHLTATIHGTDEELPEFQDLIDLLEQKVGRLLINGFPTGVEVCHSMVHGGPFPATTDARTTSVGTLAIQRFARPVCYQNFPEALLPEALQTKNPLGILRLLDGNWTTS